MSATPVLRHARRAVATERRGVALVVALLAIVIVGTLVAGVFYSSTQEYRIGRNAIAQTRAFAGAEYGRNRSILPGTWKNGTWNSAAVGTIDSSLTYTLSDGSVDSLRVTRIGDGTTAMFLVTSTGRYGAGTNLIGRRRTGMLVTLLTPQLNM